MTMTTPLSPEREAEIREWIADLGKRTEVGPYAALLDAMAEVDRLRAESEGRRQSAAAANASTRVLQQQIDEQAHELDRLRAELVRLRAVVHSVETVKCWTNEDGRRFVFAEDLAFALGYKPTTPAAPSV